MHEGLMNFYESIRVADNPRFNACPRIQPKTLKQIIKENLKFKNSGFIWTGGHWAKGPGVS